MTAPPPYDHRRISEGYCPTGHRLRVRDDLPDTGWCVTCRCGFSVTPEAVTLTLVPRFEFTKENAE